MRLDYLWHGLPGHPVHPPMTDATIGAYTFATVMAVVDAIGLAEQNAAKAWWLALVVGLIFTVPTALTGLLDWLTLTRWTPLWRTATTHLVVMVSATVFFGLAAIVGHGPYVDGNVTAGPLVLTLVGWVVLTVGGWIGGTITFVHGMRVLGLPSEPSRRAMAPVPYPEKELAEE
ncbi:MAG TPA: DUF2231 domain-containing protein [Gaiellaceae bacterium]|nr:DUF2231 domain-containing protein [Gaiellaceae bacterium]